VSRIQEIATLRGYTSAELTSSWVLARSRRGIRPSTMNRDRSDLREYMGAIGVQKDDLSMATGDPSSHGTPVFWRDGVQGDLLSKGYSRVTERAYATRTLHTTVTNLHPGVHIDRN